MTASEFTTAQSSCGTETRRVPQVRGGNLGLGVAFSSRLKHLSEAAASPRQCNTPSYSAPNPSHDSHRTWAPSVSLYFPEKCRSDILPATQMSTNSKFSIRVTRPNPPQMKSLKWPLIALCASLLPGCTRQRQFKVEMTWECAPDQYRSWAPDAQPVRFRYVADPHYEEVVSGQGLCDQLKGSGKKVVVVEYETWGDYFRGLVGYRQISVDGKRIVDVGGSGSSGAHAPVGPHPLVRLFNSGGGSRANTKQ